MPLVDSALGNPYPAINAIMNVARARVNDTANDISGDLLTNDAPASQTYLTAAWHWYQEMCASVGVETLIKSTVLFALPIRAVEDVAFEAYISWLGCSDGVNQFDSPAFPQDLIQPLSIWRRPNGATTTFQLMTLAEDGLPVWLNPNVFDWREDGCYFYACPDVQDMRIRYSAYRPELDISQPDALVPMMRCENPLGARVAFEFTAAREGTSGPNAQALAALADKEFQTGAASRTSRRKQRMTIRRQPYNRGRGNCGAWPLTR